jgi:hypothetical protein
MYTITSVHAVNVSYVTSLKNVKFTINTYLLLREKEKYCFSEAEVPVNKYFIIYQ